MPDRPDPTSALPASLDALLEDRLAAAAAVGGGGEPDERGLSSGATAASPAGATVVRAVDRTRSHDGDEHGGDEIDVRSYLGVVRRRWKVLVVVVLLALAAGLGRSLLQPEAYRASSTLLVRPPESTTSVDQGSRSRNAQQIDRDLANEARLLESDAVVAAVRKAYHGPLDPEAVKATVRGDGADVVTVSMRARNPKQAAELVNLYVSTYRDYRLATQVTELLDTGSKIQQRVDAIDAQTAQVSKPLRDVEAKLVTDPENALLIAQRDDLEKSLSAQLASLESQRTFYGQQLENVQLSAQLAGRGNTEILSKAATPKQPVSPKPVRDAAVALALGLLAGVIAAFLVESLDERLRTSEDLERVAGGLPTLAVVPEFDTRTPAGSVVLQGPDTHAPAAEAFRSLRTSIRFASTDVPIRILQVTSPTDTEGKTTTAANLASAFAQGGHRVVVVDADLRRPRLATLFGARDAPGLTDVLLGDVTLSDAVVNVAPDLDLLAAGSIPPNPSELLSTTRSAAVVAALADAYDLVVVDCSPVLPATDALIVSRLADATILVANARKTKRRAIRRTIEQLGHVGASILGLVLNAAPARDPYGFGYGYSYGGGHRPASGRRRGVAVPPGSDELAVRAGAAPLVPSGRGSGPRPD